VDVDADLVALLRRGEPEAAEQLIERYGDRLYRLAARITGLPAAAEAAVADSLRFAAENADRFRGTANFGKCLARIAAKAAYEIASRRQSRKELVLDDVLPPLDDEGRHFEPMEDWTASADALNDRGRLGEALAEALDVLPADYRTALVLRDIEGWPVEDVASTLGVSIAAARTRVHHARLFVRQRLSNVLRVA
jgi:RNA polymerase sigma-70 factor (ECF subfamily)